MSATRTAAWSVQGKGRNRGRKKCGEEGGGEQVGREEEEGHHYAGVVESRGRGSDSSKPMMVAMAMMTMTIGPVTAMTMGKRQSLG